MSSKFGISQFTRRKGGFYFLFLSLAFPSFLSIPSALRLPSLSLNAYFYFSSLSLVPPFFLPSPLSLFFTLCFSLSLLFVSPFFLYPPLSLSLSVSLSLSLSFTLCFSLSLSVHDFVFLPSL